MHKGSDSNAVTHTETWDRGVREETWRSGSEQSSVHISLVLPSGFKFEKIMEYLNLKKMYCISLERYLDANLLICMCKWHLNIR